MCMYMHVRMGRMCAQCARMRECSCVRAWCGGDPVRARMSECWRDVAREEEMDRRTDREERRKDNEGMSTCLRVSEYVCIYGRVSVFGCACWRECVCECMSDPKL